MRTPPTSPGRGNGEAAPDSAPATVLAASELSLVITGPALALTGSELIAGERPLLNVSLAEALLAPERIPS
jgi:hypothetical protein